MNHSDADVRADTLSKSPDGVEYLIKLINDRIEKLINNELRSINLTRSQMILLMRLSCYKGYSKLKDLEKILGVSQATLSGIVSRLEAKGLIKSLQDPGDRRVKLVELTESGRELAGKSRDKISSGSSFLKSRFTEEEYETLMEMLSRVYEAATAKESL
jgi:MarR family transcriptional repressor of mepA